MGYLWRSTKRKGKEKKSHLNNTKRKRKEGGSGPPKNPDLEGTEDGHKRPRKRRSRSGRLFNKRQGNGDEVKENRLTEIGWASNFGGKNGKKSEGGGGAQRRQITIY